MEAHNKLPRDSAQHLISEVKPLNVDSAKIKFRYWHVEPLLVQGMELLERAQRERQLYDTLVAQEATLALEVQAEESLYSIEFNSYNRKSDLANLDGALPHTRTKHRLSWLNNVRGEQTSIMQNAEEAKDRHVNKKLEQKTDPELPRLWAEFRQQNVNCRLADLDIGDTGYANYEAEAVSRDRLQRICDRRTILDKKITMIEKGGSLDFWTPAEAASKRFKLDYEEARDRLSIAAIGLERIYGRSAPLELFESANTKDETDPLLKAFSWTREQLRYLSAFAQSDQIYSISLTLRELAITKKQWIDFCSGSLDLDFEVPAVLLKNHTRTRLRGVSCSSNVEGDPFSSMALSLTPPSLASYRINTASESVGAFARVSQESPPACILGRVFDYRINLEPELCGAVTLMNLSPWCDPHTAKTAVDLRTTKWKARVLQAVKASVPIADIRVNFRLTGLPAVNSGMWSA